MDAIGESARKPLAIAVLGRDDESQFSKMVSGARPFDLDALDRLPREVLVEFVRRWGGRLGLVVREMDSLERAEAVVEAFDQFVDAVRVARVRRRAARAELSGGRVVAQAADRRRA